MCDQEPKPGLGGGDVLPQLHGVGRTVTKGEDFHAERAREAVPCPALARGCSDAKVDGEEEGDRPPPALSTFSYFGVLDTWRWDPHSSAETCSTSLCRSTLPRGSRWGWTEESSREDELSGLSPEEQRARGPGILRVGPPRLARRGVQQRRGLEVPRPA